MKQIQEAKHVSVSKAIVRLGDITAEWTSAGSVEETASVFFFSWQVSGWSEGKIHLSLLVKLNIS